MPNSSPIVHIMGAGVDKPLGMPLANELLREVAAFAKGPGKSVGDAIRSHLPRLKFSFDKYTGEQGETLAEKILIEDSEGLGTAKAVLDRYLEGHPVGDTDHIQAVLTVVTSLEEIRDKNRLEDSTLHSLAQIGGDSHQPSGGDFIISPRGITLTPVVRQAFRETFRGVMQADGLSEDERAVLTTMALTMMNVEELLGDLFSGFYTKRIIDQKQYLYVGWLFWAYLRVKMEQVLQSPERALYDELHSLPGNNEFITLNYTSKFFPEPLRDRVHHFHGDCLSYIRFDTRELIKNDQRILDASSPDDIADFIRSLDVQIDAGKIYLPGIVPPLSVKPVVSREHLETWYRCGLLIDEAQAIVITGYSFNSADEHFNDLIRKRRGNTDVRIVVINPDIAGTVLNVCRILGHAPDQLNDVQKAGFACKQGGNLLFVQATTEQLTTHNLTELVGF